MKRALSSFVAMMLVVAAVGGAVTLGASESYNGPLDDTMQSVSPVGESRALGAVTVGVGIVAVTAGANYACENEIYICKDDAPTQEQMKKVDALETKTSIHAQALSARQYQDNFFQQFDNDATGMKTIARSEGKNAYVRALENGSSEAIARSEAIQAVADYYSTRQEMLISQWETAVHTFDSMHFTAQNSSGITTESAPDNWVGVNPDYKKSSSNNGKADWNEYDGIVNETVPLVNGSTTSVNALNIHVVQAGTTKAQKNVTVASGNVSYSDYSTSYMDATHLFVKRPNDNFNNVTQLEFDLWESRWDKLEQQNTEVQNNIDDFVNLTYSQWDAGKIDSSDLVDPYLGAREYDPKNSSTWALRSAMAMGINPPSNTSSIANMTVTSGDRNYTGLLMTPGDYTLETGTTYNASNQTGTQYVWNPETGEMQTLSGEYSISRIDGPDGSTQSSVTYEDTRAGATNLTEYKQRVQRLQNLTAQVEARQQRLRAQLGGGGNTPGWLQDILEALGLGSLPTTAGIGVLVALALLAAQVIRTFGGG